MPDLSAPTLSGKVAIVTGGGQGVGLGVVQVLAARGVDLLLTGRTPATLEAIRDEIRSNGGRVEIVPGNVGERADVQRAVDTAIAAFGGLDIVINNAQSLSSLTFDEPVLGITDEQVNVPFRSGTMGSLYLMQAAYPHLTSRGGGSIVNFASSTAIAGMPGFGAYAMAKEGIRGLSRVAAKEWGPDNIRVNVVVPAALTERLRQRLYADPAVREERFSHIPLRRLGDPALDIGRAVAALVGDDLSYLTGATLVLDGGIMLIN